MKKCILNAFILIGAVAAATLSQAAVFTCPTLKPNEIYYYFDWVDDEGDRSSTGEWNQDRWRLWINGDSYLTPRNSPVLTTPLAAHYFATTKTWYLKCMSADASVGPRNNVWLYDTCKINRQNTGFICK